MNYSKIYDQIIDRARTRVPSGYVEHHHVIPKCMGGTDDNENLVALYPEEHFVAHVLLVKMFPNSQSLIAAVQLMTKGHSGKRKRRKLYGWLKRRFVSYMRENQTGSGNSQFGTVWICDGTNSKKIKVTDEIPSGWRRGRNKKSTGRPMKPHLVGRKWFNDGVRDYYLQPDDNKISNLSTGRLNMAVNKQRQ